VNHRRIARSAQEVGALEEIEAIDTGRDIEILPSRPASS
jgi:hypothetical protein